MSFIENPDLVSDFVAYRSGQKIRKGTLHGRSIDVIHLGETVGIDPQSLAEYICNTYIPSQQLKDNHRIIVQTAIETHSKAPRSSLQSLHEFITAVLTNLSEATGSNAVPVQKKVDRAYKRAALSASHPSAKRSSRTPVAVRADQGGSSRVYRVAKRSLPRQPDENEEIYAFLQKEIKEEDPFVRTLLHVKLGEMLQHEIAHRKAQGQTIDAEGMRTLFKQRYQTALEDVKLLVVRWGDLDTLASFLSLESCERLRLQRSNIPSSTHHAPWTVISYESIATCISELRQEMHKTQHALVTEQWNRFFSETADKAQKEEALKTLEALYKNNPPFSQFLQDLQRIHDKNLATLPFVKELAKRVLLGDPSKLSPFQGLALTGQLLFIDETSSSRLSLPESFQDAAQTITRRATALLTQKQKELSSSLKRLQAMPMYKDAHVKIAELPKAVSDVLLLEDGTINIGLIGLVKDVFLSEKSQRDSVERFLANALNQLRIDATLVKAIEDISIPKGTPQLPLVSLILGNAPTTPVTTRDARRACLASICVWHRQGPLGDCFLVAPLTFMSELGQHWLIKDFQELITSGALTRRDKTETFRSQGLLWPALFVKDLSEFADQKRLHALYRNPIIQQACQEVGIRDAASWQRTVATVLSEGKIIRSFRDLFETASQDVAAIQRALCIIEAPIQPLLHAVWKNAIGTLQTAPHHHKFREFVRKQLHSSVAGKPLDATVVDTIANSIHICLVPQESRQETHLSFVLCIQKGGSIAPVSEEEFKEWISTQLNRPDINMDHFIKQFKRGLLTQDAQKDTSASLPICGVVSVLRDSYQFAAPSRTSGLYEQQLTPTKFKALSTKTGRQALLDYIRWAAQVSQNDPANLSVPAHHGDHSFRVLPRHPTIVQCCEEPESALTSKEAEVGKFVQESGLSSEKPLGEWVEWIRKHVLVEYYSSIAGIDFGDSTAPCTLEEAITHMVLCFKNAAKEPLSDTAIARLSEAEQLKKDLLQKVQGRYDSRRERRSFSEWKDLIKDYGFTDDYAGYGHINIGNEEDQCTINEALTRIINRLRDAAEDPLSNKLRKRIQEPDGVSKHIQTFLLLTLIKKMAEQKKNFLIQWGDTNWEELRTQTPVYFAHAYNPWLKKWQCVAVSEDFSYLYPEKEDRLESIRVDESLLTRGREVGQNISVLSFSRKASKHLLMLEEEFTKNWQALLAFMDTLSPSERQQLADYIRDTEFKAAQELGLSTTGQYARKPPKSAKEAFAQCLEIQARYQHLLEQLWDTPGEYRIVRTMEPDLHFLDNQQAFRHEIVARLSPLMVPSPASSAAIEEAATPFPAPMEIESSARVPEPLPEPMEIVTSTLTVPIQAAPAQLQQTEPQGQPPSQMVETTSYKRGREEEPSSEETVEPLESLLPEEEPSDFLQAARQYEEAAQQAVRAWAEGGTPALSLSEAQKRLTSCSAPPSQRQQQLGEAARERAQAWRQALKVFTALEAFQSSFSWTSRLWVTSGELQYGWSLFSWGQPTGVGAYLRDALFPIVRDLDTFSPDAQRKLQQSITTVRERYPRDAEIQEAVGTLLDEMSILSRPAKRKEQGTAGEESV